MSTELWMDERGVKNLIDHLHEVGRTFFDLDDYFKDEICNTEGFVGAMHPLAEGMDLLAEASQQLHLLAYQRFEALAETVRATAYELDKEDGHASSTFAPYRVRQPRRGELGIA